MSGAHVESVQRLHAAVVAGDRAAVAALLNPDAVFMALGKTVEGGAAVADELVGASDGWKAFAWQPPVEVGDGVRLAADPAPGRRDRGLVLTVAFDGDARILRVQQQRVPPPHPDAAPLVLPQALKAAIDRNLLDKHPMLMAYVDAAGQPCLSFRGSTQTYGDDALALWVRNPDGAFVRAIGANPRVAFMYRDEGARSTYQLQGRARVADDPGERQRIFDASAPAERAHDFAMLGCAVVVDLDRVEGWAGVGPNGQIDPVNLRRDLP